MKKELKLKSISILLGLALLVPIFTRGAEALLLMGGGSEVAIRLLGAAIGTVLLALILLPIAHSHFNARRQQSLLNRIVQTVPSLVLVADSEGKIVKFNAVCEELSGYKEEEVLGKKFWDLFIVSEEVERAKTQFEAVKNGEFKGPNIAHFWKVRDGSRKLVEWSNSVVMDEFGNAKLVIAAGKNVTEKMALEARFRGLSQSPSLGIFLWSKSGTIVSANAAFHKITGYTYDDLQAGKLQWEQLIPPEFKDKCETAHAQLLETGSTQPFEQSYLRKDGTLVSVLFGCSLFESPEGEADGIAYIVNLTGVQGNHEHFQNLSDHLPQMVWITKPDGSVIYQNKTCSDYFGTSRIDRNTLLSSLHPDDRSDYDRTYSDLPTVGFRRLLEFRIADFRSSSYRWFTASAYPVCDAKGNPVRWYWAATDITSQKQQRESLGGIVNLLQKERALKQRFVSAIVHDLRTPLSSARSGALMLKRENIKNKDEVADIIADSLQRADRMIKDLLDATALSDGALLPMRFASCDYKSIIQSAVDQLQLIHGSRVIFEGGIGDFNGICSEDEVRRMLENLVNNAVKYGEENTPVTVSLSQDKNSIMISVHNFGSPIKKDEIETIFEPFSRASDRSKGIEGWGVGLALVKGIAEAHGGKVEVKSEKATGTLFMATLPRKRIGCVMPATSIKNQKNESSN